MSDTTQLANVLLASFHHSFRSYKSLADRALAQLSLADWLHVPAPGCNSIAVIVQHMVGNLNSRFTYFLSSDGEKPTRQRDQEFVEPTSLETVATLQAQWADAWLLLFDLLEALQPTDLLRTVTIRGEAHTVLAAVQRQVAHYAYHVGQIVGQAKALRGEEWQTLSIPRGQSEQFTQHLQNASNQV
ncbi:DUF1572 family protein [Hymenobacter sp.]|jgi:uncharacterized damage-inducible protein DinB|uniref:DUF1572 family protein n=1 Tax=Hymenobacter sp. TaxID=1898978 RepID=UPI002ED7867B